MVAVVDKVALRRTQRGNKLMAQAVELLKLAGRTDSQVIKDCKVALNMYHRSMRHPRG